jgi:hypothetical protein
MGALSRPRGQIAALTGAPLDLPSRETPQPALGGGDWRQAAANIGDAVAYHLKGRASAN